MAQENTKQVVLGQEWQSDSQADLYAENVAPSLRGDDLLDPVVRHVVSRSVESEDLSNETVKALSHSRADPGV